MTNWFHQSFCLLVGKLQHMAQEDGQFFNVFHVFVSKVFELLNLTGVYFKVETCLSLVFVKLEKLVVEMGVLWPL